MEIKDAKIGMAVKANKNLKLYGTAIWAFGPPAALDAEFGEIPSGNQVGVIQEVLSEVGLVKVTLFKPITYLLKTRSTAIVEVDSISELSELKQIVGTKSYYCTGDDVRIRNGASLTSTYRTSKLYKGDLIGVSDGVKVNNFLKFNLAIGGTGYVSADYCSLIKPSGLAGLEITKTDNNTQVSTGESWTVGEVVKKGLISAVVTFFAVWVLSFIFKRKSK